MFEICKCKLEKKGKYLQYNSLLKYKKINLLDIAPETFFQKENIVK